MRDEYPITSVARTVSNVLGLPAPAQAEAGVIQEIVDDGGSRDRVAVLAVDALGDHLFQRWRHVMPFLDSLHHRSSVLLRSVMPSVTCVNFATMVTGAELCVHQIKTRDDDIQCESLFDVVRAAGRRSAGVGQYGYTGAELLGRHADICGRGGDRRKDDDVERLIIGIAKRDRPDFLIAQFGTTDDRIHEFGPSSPDVAPILMETDGRVRRVCDVLLPLGYLIILLADHGQHDVDPEPPSYRRGGHGEDCDADRFVPCTWVGAR
jgi:predicted AlkP superfamily pyrophosphatase or phosphodiesterase